MEYLLDFAWWLSKNSHPGLTKEGIFFEVTVAFGFPDEEHEAAFETGRRLVLALTEFATLRH